MPNSAKILYLAIRFRLRDLPFSVEYNEVNGNTILCKFTPQTNATWKGKALSFDSFKSIFSKFNIEITSTEMKVASLDKKNWKEFLCAIETMADLVARENLFDCSIWGTFNKATVNGFKEGALNESTQYLKELYADKYVSPEKKSFVIDLRRSQRSLIVSADKEPHCFMDAASQIGSLALGYNDPEKRGMLLHPEHLSLSPTPFGAELKEAYSSFLKGRTNLKNVYFFNSGAEANEAALQLCIRENPQRKKILAFVGSFHGRSFLTLHLTHSPAKRLQFETYSDIVTFAPYPENKKPSETHSSSDEWIKLWAQAKNPDFELIKKKLLEKSDDLLKEEIASLSFIKESFEKEEYLACAIEPRQCEGGDRFGSKRFYQGLRLLTRAFNVPLIFDEVQTGFGLGGKFFWHEQFELITADGKLDSPDYVTFAKKGQVSGVLTNTDAPFFKNDASITSMHRGYLQAMAHFVHPPVDFGYVWDRILQLQSVVGKENLQNPRGQAQTFAFDLPSDVVLNKLISYRFEEGILFYPAGDKTARFRLLRNFAHSEIDAIFTSLYNCFQRASQDGLISNVKSIDAWLGFIDEKNKKLVDKTKEMKLSIPWAFAPKNAKELASFSCEDWRKVFSTLIKEFRLCLQLESNKTWNLEKLAKSNINDLIKEYETNDNFTWLDLVWHSSRKMSWNIERVTVKNQLLAMKPYIEALQQESYEPARQTSYQDFDRCLDDKRSVILFCEDEEEGDLMGLCACAPISFFNSSTLLNEDIEKNDPNVFYSIDVTVHESALNLGLGLRLKAEQILELAQEKVKAIRSRNRFPQASSMIRLNHGFGSIVKKIGKAVYSDGGDAFYQDLKISSEKATLWNPRHPSILNKGSLANFVSPAYIDNMLILKELLPKEYRHVYLASSTAEALDKAIKCFRYSRTKAQQVLSFEGHHFGNSSAASAALSGETNFFNWPRFNSLRDPKLESFLGQNKDNVLSCALEMRDNPQEIVEQIQYLKKFGIGTILRECQSNFWKKDKNNFILAGSQPGLEPDIIYFGVGPQVAVVACRENVFVDKALTMISTWDGDEHGLCLFQDRMIEALR